MSRSPPRSAPAKRSDKPAVFPRRAETSIVNYRVGKIALGSAWALRVNDFATPHAPCRRDAHPTLASGPRTLVVLTSGSNHDAAAGSFSYHGAYSTRLASRLLLRLESTSGQPLLIASITLLP